MEKNLTLPEIEAKSNASSKMINDSFRLIRDSIYNLSGELYQIKRKQAVMEDIITLYESVISITGDENIIPVTSEDVIFPSIISDREKAYIDKDHKLASLFIIDEQDQVRETITGNTRVREDINIDIESNNNSYLPSPERITHNDNNNVFLTNSPFVMRFDSLQGKASTVIDITRLDNALKVNTLILDVFPRKDNTMVENISLYQGSEIKDLELCDESVLELDDIDKNIKKMPSVITFSEVIASQIKLEFSTENSLSVDGMKINGIRNIDILYRNYAAESYIGFHIPFEDIEKEDPVLYNIDIKYSEYSSNKGIVCYVYNDKDSFDNMKKNYVTSTDNFIPFDFDKDLYILTKIESLNNTSPLIKGIQLDIR